MKITRYIIAAVVSIAGILPSAASEAPASERFTVVIDAGHGGSDAGAVDNNVKEKDINLAVARDLAARIRKGMKDVKVVMTRDDDRYLTLQERAAIANGSKGNLFISIHTNSVDKSNPGRRTVAGASVYALGLHKDKSNLQVAMRENSVIELEKNYTQKYSGFNPSKDESYIIFEMAQKKNLAQSLKFANEAQRHLVKDAGRLDRGVKQAGFWVLWATSMPSVLVELDFICNPQTANFMSTGEGQQRLGEALYKAFTEYMGGVKFAADNASVFEGNGVAVLMARDTTNNRTDKTPVVANMSAADNSKRRRRSDASRKISDARDVKTDSILQRSESDYLARVETKEEEPTAVVPKQKVATETKRTSIKGRNTADKVALEKATASQKVVEKSTTEDKRKGGYRPKLQKFVTVYRIQVLASSEELKPNNPRFCGLSPISKVKENSLYKYTYGESENRKEMETLLRDVRQKMPEAFIISGKREVR